MHSSVIESTHIVEYCSMMRAACCALPLVTAQEVHRAGCNAAAAHAQMYTMGSLLHSGSEEQKADWLPKVASGELRLQAFGVSEPNSGTDTLSLETVAVKDGDEYIINGQKMWTSRAEYSDAMLLLARTDYPEPPRTDGRARARALTLFIVDMRGKINCGKGIEISPVETMMNHSTTTIFFDNLRVPAANVIGGEGNGFKTVLGAMNAERVLIAAECIGDGRFFIDRATQYLLRSISLLPSEQFCIGVLYCSTVDQDMRCAEQVCEGPARVWATHRCKPRNRFSYRGGLRRDRGRGTYGQSCRRSNRSGSHGRRTSEPSQVSRRRGVSKFCSISCCACKRMQFTRRLLPGGVDYSGKQVMCACKRTVATDLRLSLTSSASGARLDSTASPQSPPT